MNQPPLIHDYTPTVLIETIRGDVGGVDLYDNDDANSPLCDHGMMVCDECGAEMAREREEAA